MTSLIHLLYYIYTSLLIHSDVYYMICSNCAQRWDALNICSWFYNIDFMYCQTSTTVILVRKRWFIMTGGLVIQVVLNKGENPQSNLCWGPIVLTIILFETSFYSQKNDGFREVWLYMYVTWYLISGYLFLVEYCFYLGYSGVRVCIGIIVFLDLDVYVDVLGVCMCLCALAWMHTYM